MRSFISTIMLIAISTCCQSADPAAEKETIVRPAVWWSDLGQVSDGGGPALKLTTEVIGSAEEFKKLWEKFGLKGAIPRLNFKEYFAVVDFRYSGFDFGDQGGLSVNSKGEAKVVVSAVEFPVHIVTNAGHYSTTIGIFPRKGIASVAGQQLPKVE